MARRHRLLEWFRDEDGSWRSPEGRRGELVGLGICLPALAVFVHFDVGLPRIAENRPAAFLGVWCGFLYATYYRTALVERTPGWVSFGQVFSLLAGGFGLTVLEIVHIADPTVLFVLTAGGTVLLIYLVRLCSPLHPGLEPPRRGADPPTALETESSTTGSDG
jgi:hypothetical protein